MKPQIEYFNSLSNANNTFSVGSVTTSYNNLVEMFGEPDMVNSGDGKVTFMFIVDFTFTDDFGSENGLFTLYDWKDNRPSDDSEEFEINVGGFTSLASTAARRAVEIFNTTDTRYAHDTHVMCQGYSHTLFPMRIYLDKKD